MKLGKFYCCVLLLITSNAVASDSRELKNDLDKCVKVETNHRTQLNKINQCISEKVPLLTDKQTSASDVAWGVVYACDSRIRSSLYSFYNMTKCEMTKDTGKPLRTWKTPFSESSTLNKVNEAVYKSALVQVLEYRNKRK